MSLESRLMSSSAVQPARDVLPSIDERPGAAVVIYDGNCQMCQGQVRRLAAWDTKSELAFLSLHDPRVPERYPDLTHDELMRAMVVVDPSGRRHVGAAGIRYLSTQLPRLYVLAPLLHIPGSLPLWQWLYQQVAKRRYRWNRASECDNGQCRIHFDQ